MMTSTSGKLKTLSQLFRIVKNLKKQGKKIVICHGVFDLIHPGHIRFFTAAKKHGDVLIVSVIADSYVRKGPDRPVFNHDLRSEVLSAIDLIDYVTIVNSDTAIEVIRRLMPHVFVMGSQTGATKTNHMIDNLPDDMRTVAQSVGCKLVITDGISFSSSAIIHKHFNIYPPGIKQFLSSFSQRFTSEPVIQVLSKLKSLKILIIGDAIIDQYCYSDPLGKSSKEPIVVHRYIGEETFAGGALATANHVASLTDNVTLLTVLGKRNSFESFIRKQVNRSVSLKLFIERHANTIIKRRYIDQQTKQKLFQISYIGDTLISKATEQAIGRVLNKEVSKYDLVIVNDFGHGLLTEKLIKIIVAKAKYLAINVQANSANYGFNIITKYPKANYICIDEMELRLATHDRHSDIKSLVKKIFSILSPEIIVVTRGHYGALSFTKRQGFIEVPALTDKIIDRVGAGDAFLSVTAPLAYIKSDQELLTFVGNAAAALKVQIVGNKNPIDRQELMTFISRLLQ